MRAVIVATLSLAFAGIAHVTAGGLLPSAGELTVMLALAAAGCAGILTRETSGRMLAGLLVGAQTTIHFAMTAIAGHGDGHEATATTISGAWLDAVHHVSLDLVSDAPMVLAHLAAAALTGLLLGRGERALWAALRLLTRAATFVALALRALPTVAALPARFAAAPRPTDLLPRRTALVVVSTHVRRGPPALLLAA